MTITSNTMMVALTLMGLGILFLMAWNIVIMFDNKQTNEKVEAIAKDLWDTMACKVNQTEYDAKEYMDLHHRDVLYTSQVAMRADFEKSVKNISALAHMLGYHWSVTDANNNHVPGHWEKVSKGTVIKGETAFDKYCADLLKGTKYTDKKKKVSVKK